MEREEGSSLSSEGSPSVNHVPPIVIYDPVLAVARYATGTVLTNSTPQHVALVDADGTQIVSFGGGTQYTEDAVAATNPVGTASILIRTDTPATQVTTDGDNVAQRGTNYGAAYVQLVTSAGAYIDSVGGGTQYAVDTALGATPTGTLAVAIRDDALSALTPIEGDAIGLRVDANGALWVIPSGTTVVSATDLDIRNLVATTDIVTVTGGAGQTADVKITLDSESVAVTNGGLTELAATIFTEDTVLTTPDVLMVGAREDGTGGARALVVHQNSAGLLISGDQDHDAADAGFPLKIGGYAKAAAPTNVSLDGDRVNAWFLLNGAQAVNLTAAGALIPGDATNGLTVNLGTNNDVTLASTTITGTVAVTQSGTWDEVGINDSGNAITVDWAGTAPPIGAGLEATALRVTVATDSTGVLSVDDNSGSLTVDGTFWQATQPVSGTFWQATQPVSNAGTFAVQDSQDVMLGTDFSSVFGTASLILATQADDVVNTSDGIQTSSFLYVFDGTTWDRLKGDSTDGMLVNLGANNDVVVSATNLDIRDLTSVSDSVTVQPGNTANTVPWLVTDIPATSGGLSKFHLVGAATDNATNVKASAGQVYSITAFNVNASPRYLKFHNTAGTPTAGTGVTDTFLIPGNTSGAGVVLNVDKGITFGTGIAITIVTGIADANTTAIGASEVVLNIYYK